MDIINENYHTGYKLKLDKNNYCYYADETNRNIIIKLISDYRKDILGEGCISCKDEIAISNRLIECPIIVYLESTQVAYDSIKDENINNSYAGRHDYTLIKLETLSLISVE